MLLTVIDLLPSKSSQERSLPSILRSDPLTTCIDDNDVLGKVNAGGGLTVHRTPGIAHADAIHERAFVPRQQGVSPSRTCLVPVHASIGYA
jgi:hypothetical protein